MLKALLKKQFLELNTYYFHDKKTGKKRSKRGIILYVLLFLFIFVSLGMTFGSVGALLCEPLNIVGLDWLYFSMMELIAIALGVFGSVFNTYASLYKAKDNDLLLSMPVPPSRILIVRLIGVYAMGLLYESLVLIPAIIVYFVKIGVSALSLIFSCLLVPVIGFFVLVLTCILGWAVAVISSKIKNKSFFTVLFSLLFLGGYYLIYFRAVGFMQNFAQNGEIIGAGVKKYAYPVYMLGKAATGDALSMLIITLAVAALVYLTYLVLSKSFLKIATASQTASASKKKGKVSKQSGVKKALFTKELKHFLSSPVYILNCSLGTVFIPAAAVAVAIKKEEILSFTDLFGTEIPISPEVIPLVICALICTLTSMNNISAPSVSLEGKSIWIVQSVPVDARLVLSAKKLLHLAITLPPVLISSAVIFILLDVDILFTVLGLLFVTCFVCFSAVSGLLYNLHWPNLTWQNETVPIKQSMPTFLSIMGVWIIVVAIGGVYWLLRNYVSPAVFLLAATAVFALVTVIINKWINTRGAKIFEKL